MGKGKEESFTSEVMSLNEIRGLLGRLHRDGKELYTAQGRWIMTKEAGMRNGFEWAFKENAKA